MDKDVAQIVAMTAARCSNEIGELAIVVKEHCGDSERVTLSPAIGSAVFELRELMARVFALSPGLEEEFEARLKKFDRSYY
jgi:hypothetical protein